MSLFSKLRHFTTKLILNWLNPEPDRSGQGTNVTKASSDDHVKVVYGTREVGGTIVFMNTTNPDDNDDVKNDLLHLIVVWCEGGIDGIEDLWLNKISILDPKFDAKGEGRWANAVHFTNGMGNYSDPYLKEAGWDALSKNHKLQGLACSYIRLEWSIADDAPFTGIPDLTAIIRGKKVKNLHTGSVQYSENPAYILHDYLTASIYGKELASSEIYLQSFKDAAAVCDTLVPQYQGASETKKLFTCNQVIDTAQSILDNVELLGKTMRGIMPIINGQLHLIIEQDDPVTPEGLSERDFKSKIQYSSGGKNKRYNRVIVEYIDKEALFSEQDAIYPEPGSALEQQWLDEDNGVVLEQRFKVSGCTNYYEARQMARVIAMLSRESLNFTVTAGPIALQFTVGDIVPISLKKLGWDEKSFRLIKSTLQDNGDYKLTFKEHQPYIYNWLSGVVRPPIPDSSLPNPRKVVAPSELVATPQEDGRIKLSWVSAYTYFDIQIYQIIVSEPDAVTGETETTEKLLKRVTSSVPELVIADLDAGSYEIDVRARSNLGFHSDYSTLAFELVSPTLPIVTLESATFNTLQLSATITGAGLGTTFQWRFLGTEQPAEESEAETDDTELNAKTGYSYTFTGLVPETEYFFKVRTVNVVGVSEWAVFSASTTAADITEFITNLELTQLSESAQNLINDINEQVDRLREGSENNIDDKINDIEDNLSDAIKDLDDKVNTDIGELNDNQNTLKDAVFSLDRSVALLDAETLNRIDIERVVFDLTAEYVRFREAYENRTAEQDRLVDAAVTVDPESGRIVNRAEEITSDMLQEAYQEIDAVKGQVTTQVKKLEVSDKRIQQAESELSIQADKIKQRVTYTEFQSEISSAIQALVPAYSWQFNSSDEGFTGVSSHNAAGFIVANDAVTSPAISYIADDNPMFRLRVRLHAGATWLGQVVINGAVTLSVPAPATSGWETLQVNAEGLTGYTGEITSLVFDLGPCDIDAIEIGKRGASDLALQDITTRTTNLEQEIDGRTGRMAQYATTIWVNALGYQKQSDVQQIIDSFNTTYKVSATLQEFDENDVLTKANNAQEFINGAEAYIEQQITAFIDQEDGVNAKFSMVNQRLDAQKGTITKQIAQMQNLEVDLNNASINDVLQAWNEFQKNDELQELDIKLSLADEKLKASTDELKSVTEQGLALVSLFEQSKSALTSVSTAFSNSHQAQVKQNREFEVQHKEANAKFINVEQAIVDETEARVQTEQAFQAEFESNTAKFAQVNQAIVNETEARVQTEQAFQVEFDKNAAKFLEVNQAIANETEARVQTEQAFQAKFDLTAAQFVQINEVLADETQARIQSEQAFQAEFESNTAKFVQVNQALANESQARNTLEQVLRAKIENDDTDVLADAHEFTRTAVGYCLDANGNPTSENDAAVCVAGGGTWIAGPLAEYIANMQISDGVNTASIKQLRQLFTTVDGKLVARGGWTLDNNGRVVGIAGYNDGEVGSLDLVGDVIRQGAMVNGQFVPTSYVDNSNPSAPVHVIKGRLILTDGTVVRDEADIRAYDGQPGADGKRGAGRYAVGTSNGVWWNGTAWNATPNADPVVGDIVTIYKTDDPAVQTTKRFNGSGWDEFISIIHGNQLIEGTVVADRVEAATGTFQDLTALNGHVRVNQNGFFTTYTEITATYLGADASQYAPSCRITSNSGLNGALNVYNFNSSFGRGVVSDCSGPYAFYAKRGNYGPFTGMHEGLINKQCEIMQGDIICDDELINIADMSNTILTAKPSTKPMQRNVRGVFTHRAPLSTEPPAALKGFKGFQRFVDYKETHEVAYFNALGEGVMNVCGEGGNLEAGDYICSSSISGKGMRQSDQESERPYTVAQIRHNVTFTKPTEIKQVAVIYLRG